MAWIIGLADPKEIRTLAARGWKQEVLDDLLEDVKKTETENTRDKLVAFYVDNDIFSIMSGPDWVGGKPLPPAALPEVARSENFPTPQALLERLDHDAEKQADYYLGAFEQILLDHWDESTTVIPCQRTHPISRLGVGLLAEKLAKRGWSLSALDTQFLIAPKNLS